MKHAPCLNNTMHPSIDTSGKHYSVSVIKSPCNNRSTLCAHILTKHIINHHSRGRRRIPIHVASFCEQQHPCVCDHNDSPCCHWAFYSNTQGDKQLSPDRAKNSQRGKKIYITSQHTQRTPELNVYVCVWSRAGGQSPQRAADETMSV